VDLKVAIKDCPCGVVHEMAAEKKIRFDQVTYGKDLALPVTISSGTWLVPRIYIACHGIKASELAEVAARYGFEQAES
jgi:hypothetical protein